MIFKKDYFSFGLVIGSLLPTLLFFGLNFLFENYFEKVFIELNTIYVLSIVFNFLIFRYYMVNIEMEKTGRGVLLATFIHAFIYIYIFII